MEKKDDNLIYEAYLEENLKLKLSAILCALGIGTGCSVFDKDGDGQFDYKDSDLYSVPGFFIDNEEDKDQVEQEIIQILNKNPNVDSNKVVQHIVKKYNNES